MEDPLPLVIKSVVWKRSNKPDTTLIYGEGYELDEEGRLVVTAPLEGGSLDIRYEEMTEAEMGVDYEDDEDL